MSLLTTINDGRGPIHAKYVGDRPSPRFHSGVLGFTLGEVARSRKVYYVPTSAHMAACAEKACTATRIRACCLHSTCPWRVLAWLFVSWPWQTVQVLSKPGLCSVGLGPFSTIWRGQDLERGYLCYGSRVRVTCIRYSCFAARN